MKETMFQTKNVSLLSLPILTFGAGFYCAQLRASSAQRALKSVELQQEKALAKDRPPLEIARTRIYKIYVPQIRASDYDTAVTMTIRCNSQIATRPGYSTLGVWGGKAYLWFEDKNGRLYKDDVEIAGFYREKSGMYGHFTLTYEFSTSHLPKTAQRIMLFCQPEIEVNFGADAARKQQYTAHFVTVVR